MGLSGEPLVDVGGSTTVVKVVGAGHEPPPAVDFDEVGRRMVVERVGKAAPVLLLRVEVGIATL